MKYFARSFSLLAALSPKVERVVINEIKRGDIPPISKLISTITSSDESKAIALSTLLGETIHTNNIIDFMLHKGDLLYVVIAKIRHSVFGRVDFTGIDPADIRYFLVEIV